MGMSTIWVLITMIRHGRDDEMVMTTTTITIMNGHPHSIPPEIAYDPVINEAPGAQ